MEILIFLFGSIFGFFVSNWMLRARIEEFHAAFGEQLKRQRFMNIAVEYVDNEFFVYNAETKEFMAKGKTRLEVEDALRIRYPDKLFITSGDDFDKLENIK